MIENGYLLDTNIFSMLARAKSGDTDPNCQSVLKKVVTIEQTAQLFICAITIGEVEYGLKLSTKPNPIVHADVRAIIASFPIVYSIDHNIATDYYADIRAKVFTKYAPLGARGKIKSKWPEELTSPTDGKLLGIQENDLWIVAVAMAYNLTLVTADKMEHIQKAINIAEITFENWSI